MPTDNPLPAHRRIAVIGSGIAGLASAWLLGQKYSVTLFEQNDYLGGHTHTHTLQDLGAGQQAIDTGFIVFNRPNYPHLTGLFRTLGITTQSTEMSFGVTLDGGRLEYGGSSLATLFAQPVNLLRPRFLQMVRDILRFNRLGKAALTEPAQNRQTTLGDFLQQHGFGSGLIHDYLLPMAAAIWSCPTQVMLDFPAHSFLQFFENHGLMNVQDRPQWETVVGGSARYVAAILADGRFTPRLNTPIHRVVREAQGVYLPETGERFDACVFACHADQTLALLDAPDAEEQRILGAFRFQENRAYLHRDLRLMPQRRAVWSSWNYLGQTRADGHRAVAVTYWMNHLQRLSSDRPWLVTLNPFTPPDPALTDRVMTYHHPVFDVPAVAAQQELPRLQGHRHCYFAGAWTGYGFHEDGLRSAVDVAERFGVTPPWKSPA
ncbi:NAD(P)/FAD-dependent oxidoreductase [Halothiobacillus sp. DCM-1]|uniref:NAD(P)/FAD-dependent oxidoreductase n=1 Tax=Halothiobacillus sp. DCM-1 TaxID=3112558 RepID=UPI003246C6FA